MVKTKGILLAVGVVVAAGIGYIAFDGRDVPEGDVQGAMGAAERHQTEKTRYYQELQKTQTVGEIAARFETAPAEAARMLEEHGWSKEEFDEMVEVIRKNKELKKAFDVAKRKALQP